MAHTRFGPTEALNLCYLGSALKKIIQQYLEGEKVSANPRLITEARFFLGLVLAGSLDYPQDLKDQLMPSGGAELAEAVRAYNVAREIWLSGKFPCTRSNAEIVQTIRRYARALELLTTQGQARDLMPSDRQTLIEIKLFASLLEDKMFGELGAHSPHF